MSQTRSSRAEIAVGSEEGGPGKELVVVAARRFANMKTDGAGGAVAAATTVECAERLGTQTPVYEK
jgi:hypothetical protein